MTAIADIQPIKPEEKISPMIHLVAQEGFDSIKKEIKIKVFDFDDEFDDDFEDDFFDDEEDDEEQQEPAKEDEYTTVK